MRFSSIRGSAATTTKRKRKRKVKLKLELKKNKLFSKIWGFDDFHKRTTIYSWDDFGFSKLYLDSWK